MKYLASLFIGVVFALLIACASNQQGLLNIGDAVSEGLATPEQDSAQSLALALPSPTPLVIDLSPFDGNSDFTADFDDFSGDLYIDADNPENLDINNSGNGRGIAYVDFFIYDAAGRQVDFHRENSYPYCYFQEDQSGDCNGWNFAQHNYTFPRGAPANDGIYFARALEQSSVSNKMRVAEESFTLNLSNSIPPNSFVGIENVGRRSSRDRNDDLQPYDELEFQASAQSDAFIDRVEMTIISPNGTVVHRTTDQSQPYCAFGDAGGVSCKRWNFAQHNNTWPSGQPVYFAMYTLRVVAYAGNTAVAGDSQAEVMESPRTANSPNPPPPNPQPNPGSSNFAILADGQNDVSQVNGRLVFRTFAGENGRDGEGIDHVEMSIVDEDGNTVHTRSEASAEYCAFGGNEGCNAFIFSDEGYHWYNGAQIRDNAVYTLKAVVYFNSGRSPLVLTRNVVLHY